MSDYVIRFRRLRNASPKRGMKSAWDEWQVVDGRRVVSRHDTEKQAEEWAANNPKANLGKPGAAPAAE